MENNWNAAYDYLLPVTWHPDLVFTRPSVEQVKKFISSWTEIANKYLALALEEVEDDNLRRSSLQTQRLNNWMEEHRNAKKIVLAAKKYLADVFDIHIWFVSE